MEDITDADYTHAKRVCRDFETEHLSEYHDLYVQSDTLLLVDIFNNIWNMCIERYELDCAYFFSAPGLSWKEVFRKDLSKIRSIT